MTYRHVQLSVNVCKQLQLYSSSTSFTFFVETTFIGYVFIPKKHKLYKIIAFGFLVLLQSVKRKFIAQVHKQFGENVKSMVSPFCYFVLVYISMMIHFWMIDSLKFGILDLDHIIVSTYIFIELMKTQYQKTQDKLLAFTSRNVQGRNIYSCFQVLLQIFLCLLFFFIFICLF